MAFLKFKYQHQLEQLEKLGYTDTKHIKKKLKKYDGNANHVIADYRKRDEILRHHAESMSISLQSPRGVSHHHTTTHNDDDSIRVPPNHMMPSSSSPRHSNKTKYSQHRPPPPAPVPLHEEDTDTQHDLRDEMEHKSSPRALSITTTTPNIPPLYSIDKPLQSKSTNPYVSLSSVMPPVPLLQSITSHTPELKPQIYNINGEEEEINTDTNEESEESQHMLAAEEAPHGILHRGSTLRREDRSAIFSSTTNLLDDDKWVAQIDGVLRENIMDVLDDLHVKDIKSIYGSLKVRKPQSKMRIERIFNEIKSVRNEFNTHNKIVQNNNNNNDEDNYKEELSFDEDDDEEEEEEDNSDKNDDENEHKSTEYWVNSGEYKKLVRLWRQSMTPLLADKRKSEIGLEACNEECLNVFQCICMHRLEVIVMIYHIMKASVLWRRVSMTRLLSFDGVYGYQQIFEDFQHLQVIHAHTAEFRTLCRKFEKQYPCEIGSCVVFARHYRDRSAVEECKKLYYCNLNKTHHHKNKTISIQNNKEMILEQHCDKIHSYLLHSMVKFDDNKSRTSPDAMKRRVAMNEYASGRSYSHKTKKKEKKKKENKTNSDDAAEDYELYPGIEEDEEWISWIDCDLDKTNDDEIYKMLVEHMGIFRWQALHGFHYDEYRATDTIRATFANIKEEVLYNSFHRITRENWNQTLRKAKAFHQSWAGKRIRTSSAGEYRDFISCTCVGWRSDCSISLKEVITLKLYTDFDSLQFELKKCFRFEQFGSILNVKYDRDRDIQSILERRLRDFYHWRMSLQITLKKFGRVIHGMDLYHGVNEKMILYPHASTSALSAFHGPLSTSSAFQVAKTFATDKGMVLAISSMYPRLCHCRAFDASLLSDYPEEQEWLVGFVYTRIRKVHTNHNANEKWNIGDLPPATQLRFSFFVIHLFKLQLFSLSDDLAQALLVMLDQNQNKNKIYYKNQKNKIYHRIMTVLMAKFKLFAANQRIARFDDISYDLRAYFMNKVAQSLSDGKDIYRISFFKIQKIFVNVTQIYLYNYYKLDNELLINIIQFLQSSGNATKMKQIKFLYYDYKGDIASTQNRNIYYPSSQLHGGKVEKLNQCGWHIVEKHHKKDELVYGVTIRLKNERFFS